MTCLRVIVGIACFTLPVRLPAQTPATGGTAIFLGAGVLDYSLGVDGRSVLLTGKAERMLTPGIIGEGGVSYARIRRAQLSEPTNYVIAELQVQAQHAIGRVAPYLGAGGGVTVDFRPDSSRSHATASVSLGVRAWLSSAVALRAELRARGVGGAAEGGGHTREFVIGLVMKPRVTDEPRFATPHWRQP